MINEPFAAGNSWFHQMDPRFKIVIATIYSIVVAMSYRLSALWAALGISLLLLIMARLDGRILFKRFAALCGFLVFLWLLLPVTVTGSACYQLGPFELTGAGLLLSAQISLKSLAIMAAFTALVATSPFASIGRALGLLRVPGKLVYLLLMTYRYIFVLDNEYQRLIRAAKIRGFQPGTNLHAYKTYAYLIGMLFVRASERARRVHLAMICRGFNGKFHTLHDFPPKRGNWIFAVIMGGMMLGLILLSWVPPV